MEGKAVEQVDKFRYLGVDLCGNNNLPEEIVGQINKAASVSGCLRNSIWKNPDMKISSKIRIYKTCVRPIMTYGMECRADTTITKSALRVSEMRTLRSIAGLTLRDRVRNVRVREICEVEDVVRWGRQRRRFWYAHVNRMGTSRLPYIALHGRPEGRIPPGRPPKRWMDCWESTSQENNVSANNRPQGLT